MPFYIPGRPMSNTLPKNSGRNGSPDKNENNKPLKEIQKVNYAETGEEVFFFWQKMKKTNVTAK